MESYVQHPLGQIMPRMEAEQYHTFTADIKKNGLQNPIVLYEGKILDGWNRYSVCISQSIEPCFTKYEGDCPATFVMSSNMERRHLTPGQKACISTEILPFVEAEAKTRNIRKDVSTGVVGSEPTQKGRSSAKVAKMLHISDKSVLLAKKLKREDPEIFEKVKRGAYTLNDAKRNVKAKKQAAKNAAIISHAEVEPSIPSGKFDVLVIDPPWPIEKIERDCRPNQPALLDYPTMSIEDIKRLSLVKDFALTDCHVFLWTTHRFLPMSFEILQSWGVKYVCTMTWHKPGGFQVCGLPQYNSEFILYGRVGSPSFVTTKAFNTCFNAPRGNHSEKPVEFYELLNRVTIGRRLDCFNRRRIDGWVGWGNEAKV